MEEIFNTKINDLGYEHKVCDIFLNWENVKDEILLPERKEGSGNGTIHIFLGKADEELRKEFKVYYNAVENGEDPEIGAIHVKHYFDRNNIISMLGHLCHYLNESGSKIEPTIVDILRNLDSAASEKDLVYTTSLFKLSLGSHKLRPYFKQFDPHGIFHSVIRKLITDKTAYKIQLYKNNSNEYCAVWLLGFENFTNFQVTSTKARVEEKEQFERQYILHGAPGTGKTFRAKQEASKIVSGRSDGWDHLTNDEKQRIGFVQFHPSYDYTDFVEGLKPDPKHTGSFKRYDGIFKAFCKNALKDSSHNYVFIIDEINRGELAKIFGELFYAIEPSYRGEKGRIKTQYNYLIDKEEDQTTDVFKDGFFVPENVYIIGTMNDVDRGVEAMDFAVRRRFAWIEVTAEENLREMNLSNDAIAKLKAINRMLDKFEFTKAYHIGGSFFIDVTNFEKLWDLHLSNIISEYLRGEAKSDEKFQQIRDAYNTAKGVGVELEEE